MCEREMEYDDVLKLIRETVSDVLDGNSADKDSVDGEEK